MDFFFKTAIIYAVLAFSSSASSISLASGRDNVCKEARDYAGCMRFYSKENDQESFSKMKESRLIHLDKLRKCILLSETSAEIRSCGFKSYKRKE